MDVASASGIVILGVIGLFGNLLATVVGAWLAARNAKRAQMDAARSQIEINLAAEAREEAKKAALDSTLRLFNEARKTGHEVATVGRAVEATRVISKETNEIAHSMHETLNGRTLRLLLAIIRLAEKEARDHPDDQNAQEAAATARQEYKSAVEEHSLKDSS